MPASGTFVIAGGGLAGAKAAQALREQGFDGRIVLAAEEDIRAYERPPLSKDYLQGKTSREEIFVHSTRDFSRSSRGSRPGSSTCTRSNPSTGPPWRTPRRRPAVGWSSPRTTTPGRPRRRRIRGPHRDRLAAAGPAVRGRRPPGSGTPDELMEAVGISASRISAARELEGLKGTKDP